MLDIPPMPSLPRQPSCRPCPSAPCSPPAHLPSPPLDPRTQSLLDDYLILIGTGAEVEKAGKHRLSSGGRLCIIEVDGPDEVVEATTEQRFTAENALPVVWDPPGSVMIAQKGPQLSLWKSLGACKTKVWVRVGPDVVGLEVGQKLQLVESHGLAVGVTVRNPDGSIAWGLRGYVACIEKEKKKEKDNKNIAKVRPSDDEVMAFPDREVGHAPPAGDPHVLGGFCMEPEDQESSLQRGPGLLRKSNNNKLPADLATRSEESKPYGTFCYSRISCGCLVALLAGSVHVATWSLSTAFAGQKLLPLFRGLGLALLCLPIYRFGSSFWGEAFAGPAADRRFCCGLTLAATTVCLLTPFITEWLGTGTPSTMLMVSAGAMVLVFGSFGLLLQQRRRGTLRQSFVTHLLWGSSSIVLSFGIWLALYLVAIGYVVSLSSKNSILSAILLPLSTAFLEILNVCLANWFFRRWIFKPRLVGNPGAAVGDQRLNVVPCLIACSHGFAESTRVAATVAGAIRSRSYFGIVSISVAVVVNAFTRSGWFRFMFIRATTNIQKWMKKVGMLKRTICPVEWFAPTVFSKLHDEVKFSLGYPRFAGLGALIAGRCLTKLVTTVMNLQPLAFDMRAVRPGLVVAAASLCFKVAEDLLLTKLDKNVHSPIGPVAMRYYMGLHLEDPWQILAISNVGKVQDTLVSDSRISYLKSCRTQASLAETARSSSDKLTSGVAGSVDPTVGGMVRRYWGQSLTIHHARGLHGLRLVGLQVQVGLTATCACFTMILMELLVGPTILYGMCPEPVSLEASLLQVLFWNRSPQCE